ncbi:MAG TPA: metallopeptidase TldD-related protein [Petrotogaceae bacterium]|jgi:PmbA protein|nr:metallopeptidase TldD-related protein [Petrotogaceae bacterium]
MLKEVFNSKINQVSFSVSQSKVDSIRKKDIEKTGVRVYSDGFIGVAGQIGKYDSSKLTSKAVENLKNQIPYEFGKDSKVQKKISVTGNIPDEKELLMQIEEYLDYCRQKYENLIFFNKINVTERQISLNNENGLDLYFSDRFINFDIVFKDKATANIMDGGVIYQGRDFSLEQLKSYTEKICGAYSRSGEVKYGKKLPVIFSSYDMLVMMKFITDLNGRMYGSGGSIFSNKIGEKLFSEEFTLFQSNDPFSSIPDFAFFDAEGGLNENYRFPLIEKGIVRSPYTDKKISQRYSLPYTASASAEYDGVPSLSFMGFEVKESEKTLREILKGEPGIFVGISSGGDFTPDGNFGAPVQLAFLHDGENFVSKLDALQVSSNIYDMFGKDFRGVSSDKIDEISNEKYMVFDMLVDKL